MDSDFILYLCTRIVAIKLFFLIEHLKRLSVMDGRFFVGVEAENRELLKQTRGF